jgi:hypothetical protein
MLAARIGDALAEGVEESSAAHSLEVWRGAVHQSPANSVNASSRRTSLSRPDNN